MTYGAGTEIWAYRLLEALARQKNQNTVAAFLFKKSASYRLDWQFLEFPLQRTEAFFDRENLFQKSCNWLIYRLIKTLYLFWLKLNLRPGDVDLVHSHFGLAAVKYHGLAKKLGVPHVVSFYGSDYEKLPFVRPSIVKAYQKLFREADFFVCEGGHGRSVLIEKGCPSEKIEVVHLGIEPKCKSQTSEVFQPSEVSTPEKPRKFRLIQAATFTEKKGQIFAVEAFAKAQKTCPNMDLTFIGGDKGTRKTVEKRVLELGLGDKIHFENFVEPSEFHRYLADFQVFIHPSCHASNRDCEGGAPVVLLEAQGLGLPVISTFHCDIPEEVLHEKTGLLSPEKDVDSLAASIRRFYEMPENEFWQFSENARQHVENEYDIRKSGEKLTQIYRKTVLTKNNSSA